MLDLLRQKMKKNCLKVLEALLLDDTEEIESDLQLMSGVLDGLIHAHAVGSFIEILRPRM